MTTTERATKAPGKLPEHDASAAPRKRRRRAAATGAAEDCFTCRKRQTPCDRRRPYCSQCLETGKDCSGYKTTLTWGVGIASRGKLRGLSCPVAKPSTSNATESKKTAPVQKRKPSVSKASRLAKDDVVKTSCDAEASVRASTTTSTSPYHRPVKIETSIRACENASLPTPIEQSPGNWSYSLPYPSYPSPYTGQTLANSQEPPYDSRSVLSDLNPSLNHPGGESSYLFSTSSMGSFGDISHATPAEYSPSPASQPYGEVLPPFFGRLCPPVNRDERKSSPLDGVVEGADSAPSMVTVQSRNLLRGLNVHHTHNDELEAFIDFSVPFNNLPPQQSFDDSIDMGLSIPRTLYHSQFFHLPMRMQYLLDYYNQHICSVLVAFDSPVNPYRLHILELATQNEGLQNALAALALNNMRMRTQEPIASRGFVEEMVERGGHSGAATVAQSQPSPEETCYKSISITQLQMQLSDPRFAKDDSILATLLILCLFHVCDSGFSKFKTQLEGVQKLLTMRDPHVRTGFIGWVEMFFAWFDVMSSTVNDRETAIRGDRLDMLQYSSNLGALEEFSGCDGRLFKLIARLGRLNLLSQNRPVRSEQGSERPVQPPMDFRRYKSFGGSNRWSKRRAVDPMDFTKLDGNGWGNAVGASSDDEEQPLSFDRTATTDGREEFWGEWNDIRARLHSWTMNPSDFPSPSSSASEDHEMAAMAPEQRDMVHINESFRSSAILYTERLAYPHSPSSSQNFQNLVRDALSHIGSISVTSCVNKFLLWPLFIAGSECVLLSDRNVVRERCIEIQRESGFYNNISVLEVLERVWSETGGASQGGEDGEMDRRRKESTTTDGGFGQAFRWRKAMNRVDGEYIIV